MKYFFVDEAFSMSLFQIMNYIKRIEMSMIMNDNDKGKYDIWNLLS